MTIVELLLALVITSIIGLAGAGVVFAVSHAQRRSDACAENLQAGRAGLGRMQSLIRCARLVTACDEQSLVLWVQDDQELGVINADEVVVLRYDEQAAQVTATQVRFPDSLGEATRTLLNTQLSVGSLTDADSSVACAGNANYRVERVVATDVQSLRFLVDEAPPNTWTVTIDAVFGAGEEGFALVTATSLRSPATDCLAIVDGAWDLVQPTVNTGDMVEGQAPGGAGSDGNGGNNGNGNGNNGNGNGKGRSK